MNNLDILTAEQILDIKKPEQMFIKEILSSQIKSIRSKWHPDRNNNPKSTLVIAHINKLYDLAIEKINNNQWDGAAIIRIHDIKINKKYDFSYNIRIPFELGSMYIGNNYILYNVDLKYKKLYNNFVDIVNIKYNQEKLKLEFENKLPKIVKHCESHDGYYILINRPPNHFRLKDVLENISPEVLPATQVAWVISTLCNIHCLMQLHNISHNALSIDNYWIDIENHSGALLGGWWYSNKIGNKLLGLPQSTIKTLPKKLILDKVSKVEYDSILIKGIGLNCFGDLGNGSSLLKNSDIPKPFLDWLRKMPTKDAFSEFVEWSNYRDNSFGKRKFIKYYKDIKNIY